MKSIKFQFCQLIATSIVLIYFNSTHAIEPAKNNWQLGVCTSITKGILIKKAGFSYIEEGVSGFLMPNEPDTKFDEKLKILNDSGIVVYSCNGFIPGSMKSVGPDTCHTAILKYVQKALERAQKAGVKVIVFGSGQSRRIPDGFNKETAKKQFVSLASKIADVARIYNVTICLETLNRGETNFINTLAEAVEIIKAVNNPYFRLNVDLFHMMRENESPEEIIKAAPYVAHCHIAEKESRTAPGVKGDDFSPYFSALKKIGYTGCISVECSWKNMETELPIAFQTLNSQIGKIE